MPRHFVNGSKFTTTTWGYAVLRVAEGWHHPNLFPSHCDIWHASVAHAMPRFGWILSIFSTNATSSTSFGKWLLMSLESVPTKGSARCLPGPMFPSPYDPRFMILVPMFPMFPSPYVTQKCFPVPLLPELILHSPCVPKYPCFPYSPAPMFPSPYVPQSLCPPVHLFPSPYRCSPVPMIPSPYVPQLINQSLCSPLLFHRSVFHSLYSPHRISSPYVPQCLCSPKMFPSPYVPQCLCSPNMFHSPYVPQSLCSSNYRQRGLNRQWRPKYVIVTPMTLFKVHFLQYGNSYHVYILNRYYLCNDVFVCAFSWRLERVTFEFGVVPIWGELLIYLL